MHHAKEMSQVFFISSSNSSVVLQFKKEILDQMPVFIQKLIIFSRFFGIPAARNHWNPSLAVNRFYEFFTVVTLVCKDITVLQIEGHHQFFSRFVITDLTACQINFNRITQRIDYGVDLGGISTSRTTNSLLFRPPFPPAPCWCTRIYVPSIS